MPAKSTASLRALASPPALEDRDIIVDDYPLLPVRRRFWEHVLRAVDVPGTASQLRTQLKIVHEAVRQTAEAPLGTVVPADFIFGQLHPDLLRSGMLLREIDETIRNLDDRTNDGRLAQRLCGLIFLIRKLPREAVADIGVRATPEMLADLLVSDLSSDGTQLRKEIPRILKKLVDAGTLIKLDEEYSLQTRESSEWDREFRNRQTRLNSDPTSLSSKRGSLISAGCGEALKGIKVVQGKCKEPRKLLVHFGTEAPAAGGNDIPVWVRDGWGEKESTVVNDARAAGSDSAIIYVYVPKASADDLQKAIVEYEAAKSTLDFKGTPTTPEGREARDAMATRMATAEATRNQIIQDVIDQAKVFQGGGNEWLGLILAAKVEDAARRRWPGSSRVSRMRTTTAGPASSTVPRTATRRHWPPWIGPTRLKNTRSARPCSPRSVRASVARKSAMPSRPAPTAGRVTPWTPHSSRYTQPATSAPPTRA